jgi:hypothetical protein
MKKIKTWKQYEKEIEKLEAEGLTTSDAQAIVDLALEEMGIDLMSLSGGAK